MAEGLAERALRLGVAALSSAELFAFALARRPGDLDSAEMEAKELLRSAGKLRNIHSLSPELLEVKAGLDSFETIRCFALLELGRRTSDAGRGAAVEISGPEDVFTYFRHLKQEKLEHFCALLLDTKNGVLRDHVVHIGTVNSSIVGVKEFFREAVREAASSVVAVHNHPSGDPTPSPEDFEVTRTLAAAGKLLQIPLVDHVIIGETEFRSMQRLGAIA